jgi:hypothetical protein
MALADPAHAHSEVFVSPERENHLSSDGWRLPGSRGSLLLRFC